MAGTRFRSNGGIRPSARYDDDGAGAPHWWSEADRQALLAALKGYNVVGIFHGHQHETPMIYRATGSTCSSRKPPIWAALRWSA